MDYNLLFLSIPIAAAAILIYYWRRIRRDHFYRLAQRALLNKQEASENTFYFSSRLLADTINYLLRQHQHKAFRALLNLSLGKTAPAESYLREKGKFLEAASLQAYNNPETAAVSLLEAIRKNPQNYDLLTELAILYDLAENATKVSEILNKIPEKKISRRIRARMYYLRAREFLKIGSMLDASAQASAAASLFRKNREYTEEGRAYLLLGTIYRIAAVEDIAHFMLEQAAKIFKALKNAAGESEALGNLGMLWVMKEQFDKADDYFQKALLISRNFKLHKNEGYVLTQISLSLLLQGKLKQAQKTAEEARRLQKKNQNPQGMAFSSEVLSYIFYKQKKWKEMKEQAQAAEPFYKSSNDTAAFMENQYLQALADFESGKPGNAEKKLRLIIRTCREKSNCFHAGNAYNLLGLIYLRRKEFKRAKGLFLQSAALEQKEERFSGAATDYANIALIENKLGNKEQALKTFETALEYASAFEENELSEILKEKINQLRAQA